MYYVVHQLYTGTAHSIAQCARRIYLQCVFHVRFDGLFKMECSSASNKSEVRLDNDNLLSYSFFVFHFRSEVFHSQSFNSERMP